MENESASPGSPGAEAAATALALERAGQNSRPADSPAPADAFLKKETEKLEYEIHHLRLSHFDKQLSVALKLMTIAVGAVIAVAAAVLTFSAARHHGLVIEAFSAPPDLSARGLSGEVLATQMLDKIATLQAATATDRPPESYENNWGDDIKVEIPETGVSIGELNRGLRRWLGKETRISGEVVRTDTGLAVSARAGAHAAQTFQGDGGELDALMQRAAEAVYAQTQPYRYAVYLASKGKMDEAIAAYAKLAQMARPRTGPGLMPAGRARSFSRASSNKRQRRARRPSLSIANSLKAMPVSSMRTSCSSTRRSLLPTRWLLSRPTAGATNRV